MDQRKSDPRIYIVTLLFLSCILSGGVLLGLYLLLSDPNPLFLQAGMVFVGVPWLFWFLAYLYSCVLKPCTVSVTKSVAHFDPEKGDHNNNNISDNTTSASDPDPVTPEARNSPREGEKHVQFGNVEIFGGEQGGKEENEGSSTQNNTRSEEEKHQEIGRLNSRSDEYDDDDDDESSFDEDCDRTPLRLSVANK